MLTKWEWITEASENGESAIITVKYPESRHTSTGVVEKSIRAP
jgi:hypothetical protein